MHQKITVPLTPQTPILFLKAWSRDTFSGIYLTKYRHLCVSKIAYVFFLMEKNAQLELDCLILK